MQNENDVNGVEQAQELKNVKRLKRSSYRNNGEVGSKIKHFRLTDELAPLTGEAWLRGRYLADLVQNAPVRAWRLFKAMRTGLGLVEKEAQDTWDDDVKVVSDSKAGLFVLAHIKEEPYKSLVAADKTEAAKAEAVKFLSKGPAANRDKNITREDADAENDLTKEHWNRIGAEVYAALFPASASEAAAKTQ